MSLPLTGRVTVEQVAEYLRTKGVRADVYVGDDDDDTTDDEILLGGGDNAYVQVGRGYAIVHAWLDDNTVRNWPTRHDAQELLDDVIDALNVKKGGA